MASSREIQEMLEAFANVFCSYSRPPKGGRVGPPTPCTLASSQKAFLVVGSKEGGWWGFGFGFSSPTVIALLRVEFS